MSARMSAWAAAAALALALGASYLLDGPSDIDAAQAVAADVQDAQHTAQTAAADLQVAAQ